MAHMVIFQSADGAPGYQQCESIDDAVKYVEELRNDRGIERARIFRMEEVEFEFRPYWFVVQRAGAEPEPLPEPLPEPVAEPIVAEAVPAPEPFAAPAALTAASDEPVAVEPEPVDAGFPPPLAPPPTRGLFGR